MSQASRLAAWGVACLLLFATAFVAEAAPPAKKNSAVNITKQFWTAMFKKDLKALKSLVETPFAWDSPCTLKLSLSALIKHIKTGPPAPKHFKITKIREITKTTKWIHPYTVQLIRRFAQNATPNRCRTKYKAAQQIIRSRKHRYVMVDMRIGRQLVPTLTRLSQIKGKWFVTGFDN